MTLSIPERPLKGKSSVATLNPKMSIRIGAKRTSMVLSVPPINIMLIMNVIGVRAKHENIFTARSKKIKTMIVKVAPFLSARKPHAILKIAELRMISMSPILMR